LLTSGNESVRKGLRRGKAPTFALREDRDPRGKPQKASISGFEFPVHKKGFARRHPRHIAGEMAQSAGGGEHPRRAPISTSATHRNTTGQNEENMGDGVLIYFGYPEAHEDDAERAARAGLAVMDAVGRLATQEPLNHFWPEIAISRIVD
jgi:hypothetical protein